MGFNLTPPHPTPLSPRSLQISLFGQPSVRCRRPLSSAAALATVTPRPPARRATIAASSPPSPRALACRHYSRGHPQHRVSTRRLPRPHMPPAASHGHPSPTSPVAAQSSSLHPRRRPVWLPPPTPPPTPGRPRTPASSARHRRLPPPYAYWYVSFILYCNIDAYLQCLL
jgi:hypothetical protein